MSRAVRIALVVAGLAALLLLQEADRDLRKPDGAVEVTSSGGLPPGVAAAALGGLRAPAIAALWLDADRLRREEQWWALRSRYEMIVRLEPRIASAWGMLADRMILEFADAATTADEAWSWTREGLLLYRRGLEVNPGSYWLRRLLLARLVVRVGPFPELSERFRAWRGRPVREEALEVARDLARLYGAESKGEAKLVPWVHRVFAYQDFRRAWDGAAGSPAARAYASAEAGWRRAAEESRRLGESEDADYETVFADLSAALPGVTDPTERSRLVREKLGRYEDYVEAKDLLERL